MTGQRSSIPADQTHGRGAAGYLAVALDYLGLLAVLVLLIAYFSVRSRTFLSRDTFITIANQIPATVVVAVGMTYVLIIAGIDLSVGSVLALSGAVLGMAMVSWQSQGWVALVLAVAASLAAGAACGLVNGAVSVLWRIPSFIVTLGMLEMARGATHLLTESRTQYIGSAVAGLAGTKLFSLSMPFYLAMGVVAAGQLVLSRTVFGRYMVAIGTNEEAVRLAGVNPRPVKIAVFALTGLLAAVAGVIDTSRFEAANPNAGAGLELQVIAAVVIGGTSLMGGRGSVVRSLLGVLIIAVLGNGLANLGARDETKRLITGLVIVAAVILDHYRHRLGAGKKSGI